MWGWYLMVVLNWTSLIISDVEHLFICLLAICIFFGKMSIHVFWPLLIGLFVHFLCVWYWVVWTIYIFWILTFCQSYHLQILSYTLHFEFWFCWWLSWLCKSSLTLFSFHLFIFAFISFALEARSQKNYCYNLCQREFCLCSLLGVL